MKIYIILITLLYTPYVFTQEFNNLISKDDIDLFFLENEEATSVNTEWGFTFIHEDSLFLKQQVKKLLNQVYSLSEVYTIKEDDDPKNRGYIGNYGIDIIENRLYNAACLYEKYTFLLDAASELRLSLIGFYVAEQLESMAIGDKTDLQLNNQASYILTGTILDKSDKRAISYVNLGIFDKNVGTVSDLNGDFTLEVAKSYIDDKITFSCIGYKTLQIPVKSFLNGSLKLDTPIYMEQNVEHLNEVIVSSSKNYKKTKRKIVGAKRANENQSGFIRGRGAGAEVGRLMSNNKNILVNSISIFIGDNKEENFVLRSNLYSEGKEIYQPGKNLLKKPIIIKSTIKSGWLNISLEETLITNSSFYVTFEWIDENTQNPVIALNKGNFSKNHSIQRSVSQGKWVKSVDFDWAIKCEVTILNL